MTPTSHCGSRKKPDEMEISQSDRFDADEFQSEELGDQQGAQTEKVTASRPPRPQILANFPTSAALHATCRHECASTFKELRRWVLRSSPWDLAVAGEWFSAEERRDVFDFLDRLCSQRRLFRAQVQEVLARLLRERHWTVGDGVVDATTVDRWMDDRYKRNSNLKLLQMRRRSMTSTCLPSPAASSCGSSMDLSMLDWGLDRKEEFPLALPGSTAAERTQQATRGAAGPQYLPDECTVTTPQKQRLPTPPPEHDRVWRPGWLVKGIVLAGVVLLVVVKLRRL